MPKLSYDKLLKKHLKILKDLQADSGLFLASAKNVSTGYDKSWLRDNFYETLAFEVVGDWGVVEKTYDAILKTFLKHEDKIDKAIETKPKYTHEYIHARFHPETFNEFWEEWGNKQNDAVGCILFRIGELETNQKLSILNSPDKIRIVQKLVDYLESIEYWHDPDSGMWEENEELHASSVGACVAGLSAVLKLPQIKVPINLIEKGEEALHKILPRESEKKFVDLSQLSLIWPYDVVNEHERSEILKNVEYHLLRDHGVIRYKGDRYYNKNTDGISEEAEWTFGLCWLSIIYKKLGDERKAYAYLKSVKEVDTPKGLPELYFSNSLEFNDNTPLGWSESLFIIAMHELERD